MAVILSRPQFVKPHYDGVPSRYGEAEALVSYPHTLLRCSWLSVVVVADGWPSAKIKYFIHVRTIIIKSPSKSMKKYQNLNLDCRKNIYEVDWVVVVVVVLV